MVHGAWSPAIPRVLCEKDPGEARPHQGRCVDAVRDSRERDRVRRVRSFPDAFRWRGQGFTVGKVVSARGVGDLQDGVVILRWL